MIFTDSNNVYCHSWMPALIHYLRGQEQAARGSIVSKASKRFKSFSWNWKFLQASPKADNAQILVSIQPMNGTFWRKPECFAGERK